MADALNQDPIIAAHFMLELEGAAAGYFTEVSGMGFDVEVVEHKIMGPNNTDIIRKVPGRQKWSNITLKRGVTSNTLDINDWIQQVMDGDVQGARKNISIIMFDQTKAPAARWDIEKAYPVKVSTDSAKADGNNILMTTLELVHEGIERTM